MNATSANNWPRSYGKRGILDGDLSCFLKKPSRDSIKGVMMQRLQSEPVADGQLSAAQIAQWRNTGRVLVKGLLDSDQLRALTALALQLFPAPGAAEAAAHSTWVACNHPSFCRKCAANDARSSVPTAVAVARTSTGSEPNTQRWMLSASASATDGFLARRT